MSNERFFSLFRKERFKPLFKNVIIKELKVLAAKYIFKRRNKSSILFSVSFLYNLVPRIFCFPLL